MAVLLAPTWSGNGAPPGPAALRWPLDPPVSLRSAFGEYREGGRVHGGVDLSTGGQTGVPVHAAADGEIFRLKVEWRGYGRAIYQKLPDDRIAVYAHLERFVLPGLAEAVEEARRRAGRFPGDIPISPPIPVRTGDLLARSGESGAGFPHLHFEVRSADNAPQDPVQQEIRPPVEDRDPPVFAGVWFFATAPGAWVEGASWVTRVAARRAPDAASEWEASGVRAAGPIDLAVEAHDPEPEEGRIGVSSLRLLWDGRELSAIRVGPFTFDELRTVAAIHDADLSHLVPTRLVYRPLAALEGPWSARAGSGRLEGAPGTTHALEIEARDASGNVSRLHTQVRFVEQAELVRSVEAFAAGGKDARRAAGRGAVRVDPEEARWLAGAVEVPVVVSPVGAPPGTARPAYALERANGREIALRRWAATGDSGPGGTVGVAVLPPDGRIRFEPEGAGPALEAAQRRAGVSELPIRCGASTLRLPAGAFPRGTAVTVQERRTPPSGEGFLEAGPAVQLEPAWRVPARPARLQFKFDPRRHRAERMGVYRWDRERRRWIYAGGVGEARDAALEVEIGDLGTFRLLEDTEPPVLGEVHLLFDAHAETPGWILRLEVEDRGSGIAWDGIEIEFDGRRIESEFDPDRKRADARLDSPPRPGTHHLRALARDRAGNRTAAVEHTLEVEPGR